MYVCVCVFLLLDFIVSFSVLVWMWQYDCMFLSCATDVKIIITSMVEAP